MKNKLKTQCPNARRTNACLWPRRRAWSFGNPRRILGEIDQSPCKRNDQRWSWLVFTLPPIRWVLLGPTDGSKTWEFLFNDCIKLEQFARVLFCQFQKFLLHHFPSTPLPMMSESLNTTWKAQKKRPAITPSMTWQNCQLLGWLFPTWFWDIKMCGIKASLRENMPLALVAPRKTWLPISTFCVGASTMTCLSASLGGRTMAFLAGNKPLWRISSRYVLSNLLTNKETRTSTKGLSRTWPFSFLYQNWRPNYSDASKCVASHLQFASEV